MAVMMEATKSIVAQEPKQGAIQTDEFDRQPFEHPKLQSLDNLNVQGPKDIVGKEKLFQLGLEVGLIDVVRWKPRLVR
jgi:large subunit ribosomal protein L15